MDGGFTFGKVMAGLAVTAALYVGGSSVNHGNRLTAAESKLDAITEVAADIKKIREDQVTKEDFQELKATVGHLEVTQDQLVTDTAVVKTEVQNLKSLGNRIERSVTER